MTSRMLGAMKAIKMTGLTDLVSATIAALREQEICASGLFRLYTVFNITLCTYIQLRPNKDIRG